MRPRPRFLLALTTMAIAPMILTTSVSAGPGVKAQRVMLEQKHRFGAPNGTFVFYTLTTGPLELDSGRYEYAASEQPNIVRKGQRAAVYHAVESLTGKPGSVGWDGFGERLIVREGQRVGINGALMILVGKQGTLEIHSRIEWLDAGNGHMIGASTWKIVRATGAYAGVSRGGRGASSWLPRGPVSFRLEGFLSLEKREGKEHP